MILNLYSGKWLGFFLKGIDHTDLWSQCCNTSREMVRWMPVQDRSIDPIRGEFSSSQLVQGDLVKHSLSANAYKIICKVMLSGAASSGLSADSVWHQIYSICFTGRGVLVQQLTVSHHSETHTGLIAGFFWMKLLYPIVLTLVSFSCQRCIKLELARRH